MAPEKATYTIYNICHFFLPCERVESAAKLTITREESLVILLKNSRYPQLAVCNLFASGGYLVNLKIIKKTCEKCLR